MLFDLQNGTAAIPKEIYDICVCGTGPAGITVARELASSGLRVVLLEAGGFDFTERSQDAYAGTESGINTYNLALKIGRLRYFGGTSNHWSGMCGTFEESDFWPQRYHNLSGWPIKRAEVNEHLREASQILDLKTNDFASRPFGTPTWSTFERKITSRSPPTRFGTKYREEVIRSKYIDLYINANVVDIHLQEKNHSLPSIDHVVVSNYNKVRHLVIARRYVLALGTIENARILLNSKSQLPRGIGNHSGFVGQCYMEHLNVLFGRYVANSNAELSVDGTDIGPTNEILRKHNIGNGILNLSTSKAPVESGRLASVRKIIRSASCENETVREFARKFKDFTCAGDGVISSLLEQAPDRNNCVKLGTETDEFGMKRPHLHWALSDSDRKTIRFLGYELAQNFVKYDIGRIKLSDFIIDPKKEIEVWPHAHQMGTTRMSVDPKDGVVDSNCRVHSVANLYIAGSSVFPTGGGINPTLTIVMLALRLGRHLRKLAA